MTSGVVVRRLTSKQIAQIRELRYGDGLSQPAVAQIVGCSTSAVSHHAPGWPGKVSNDLLRAAFMTSGLSAPEVARRVGWWGVTAARSWPDGSRVRRALGLQQDIQGKTGRRAYRRLIDAEVAASLAEAIGVMPWEVGGVTSWWDGPMLALDLETTDKDPEAARIVTAALVLVRGHHPRVDRSWLADPGVEIAPEATAVHGVTTERARAEGRPADEVVWEVVHAICTRPAGAPIVAFRASFDLTILDREARRHGLASLSEYTDWLVVDPSVLDRHLDRYRSGSRTLAATCEHYGAGLDDAHDAMSDALAAARLAWKIGKHGQIVRRAWNASMEAEREALIHHWESVRGDLGLLHAAQRVWHEDSMIGLAKHFEAKGEPKPVETAWPIVPWKPVAEVQAVR